MPRRLHAPGCLLAVLSLVAPRVANAEPAADDAATALTQPAPAEARAADAPNASDRDTTETAAAAEDPLEPEGELETEDELEPDGIDDEDDIDREDDIGDEDDIDGEDDIDDEDDIDGEDDIDDEDDIDGEGDIDGEDDIDDEAAPPSPLPDHLPRLQRIGWYHVLGAFTLGTTAGLLAGLAERQEDKATRIASGYDLETGGAVLYAERQEAYESSLDRGQAFQTSAIVVGALAGATAIAAITLFAVDAKRRGPSATARRTRIGPGSLEVSF